MYINFRDKSLHVAKCGCQNSTKPQEALVPTIPYLCNALHAVFNGLANSAARTSGFIQRQRQLTGASFVQALVFGFLAKPTISLDQLAQTATALGSPISAQGLDQRFTPQAADCLQLVLAAAIQQMVCADPVAIPLLQRFPGVYLLDSTTIMLPDALGTLWRGNGGSTPVGTSAALKLQVLWNLTDGTLQHLGLQHGRASDNASPAQDVELPAGALRIADLGYFGLDRLAKLTAQQVFVLSRLNPQVALFDQAGVRQDLLQMLEQAQDVLEQEVRIGARQRVRVRLLAVRVPQEVADQRRRRMRKELLEKGKVPTERTLAFAGWTIAVTTVPRERLSLREALVLLRTRWQIELLFKLWKSHGQIDRWRSEQPWRVLCEVYAKLLAMVVLHWVLLVSCWQYPNRSLMKAAQTVQQHAMVLALGLGSSLPRLKEAVSVIQTCLAVGGRLNTRKTKLNTYQLLLTAPYETVS
jgi:hypothetical protein